MKVRRAIDTPIRQGLTTEQAWKGEDNGLIKCWEVGRKLAMDQPSLALRARAGALPELDTWKGGIRDPLKSGWKYGTYQYLATWQGLSGQDLKIDTDDELEMICSATGTRVVFTYDVKKYGKTS